MDNMGSQTHVTMDEYASIMLDQIPAGVALFDARDLRLLAANKLFYRFLEMYQAPSGDGQSVILTEWLAAGDPADAAALIAIFRNVAETGIPYQTEEYAAPVFNRGQKYWNWSLHPVRNEQGHIVQLIFHGSDVTARQRDEQAYASLTQAHGTSEMARKRVEDEALIWVRDRGIGIPKNEVHLIFRLFHRAGNLNNSMSGLGVGLYLVKEMVTRHEGRIWVESTEGEGSTFYILLPLKKERHSRTPR